MLNLLYCKGLWGGGGVGDNFQVENFNYYVIIKFYYVVKKNKNMKLSYIINFFVI